MSINFYNILRHQYVSEKTVKLAEGERRVTLEVCSNANKWTIRKTVEFLFNVKVKTVNILNVKKSSVKKNKGKISKNVIRWKKAIVLLQKDFFINFSQYK